MTDNWRNIKEAIFSIEKQSVENAEMIEKYVENFCVPSQLEARQTHTRYSYNFRALERGVSKPHSITDPPCFESKSHLILKKREKNFQKIFVALPFGGISDV